LSYNSIFLLTKVDTRGYLNHLFPLGQNTPTHSPLESELKVHPIPSLGNGDPLLIDNRINFLELNCKATTANSLVFPKSDLLPISHSPSEPHSSCVSNPANPFPKGGAIPIIVAQYVERVSMILIINNGFPQSRI
jgi:hypothetical protein